MSGRSVISVTLFLDRPPTGRLSVLSRPKHFFITSMHAKFYVLLESVKRNNDRRNATMMVDHRPALFREAHATKLSIVPRAIIVGFEFPKPITL